MNPNKGNIDLRIKKPINNKDGSISTVRTIGIEADGMYINIPTVIGGKVVSNKEAIDYYRKTGKHLGKYKTRDERDAAARQLSIDQGRKYSR